MIGYIARKFRRHRAKRTFREYGFAIRQFTLPGEGVVEYAQWLHPFEKPKVISQDDVDGLRRFVREGDTALDVGAHTGDTTVPIALACGRAGLVVALEPNPYVFKVLAENARRNRERTNIVPLNFAATEEDGTFEFHYWDASFGNGGYLSRIHNQRHGHRFPLAVEGRNLERHLRAHFGDRLKRLSFVKTDTEGYDKDVLRSIRALLAEARPVVVCEVHKKLDDSERRELFGVLAGARYRLFRYLGGRDPVGDPLGPADVRRWDRFDVVALPEERADELRGSGRARRSTDMGRYLRVTAWVALGLVLATVTPVLALRWVDPPTSSFMIQRRLAGLAAASHRPPVRFQWVDWNRMSPHLRLAIVAAEDQRFLEHEGFDFESIEKAREFNRRRGRARGASTISQQVAKNLFLWPGKTYLRKGLEAGYTILIETLWPKRRILEVYLNVAEFGDGIYGVSAASEQFFHEPASRVSRSDAALLAAVLPNPKRMHADRPSPYVQRRAWWIERQMLRIGYHHLDSL